MADDRALRLLQWPDLVAENAERRFRSYFQFESVSDDEWIARTTILEGGISLHPLPGLEK
jgi:hypothetical protein